LAELEETLNIAVNEQPRAKHGCFFNVLTHRYRRVYARHRHNLYNQTRRPIRRTWIKDSGSPQFQFLMDFISSSFHLHFHHTITR